MAACKFFSYEISMPEFGFTTINETCILCRVTEYYISYFRSETRLLSFISSTSHVSIHINVFLLVVH